MNDLVERLRLLTLYEGIAEGDEAADEIERLRRQLKKIANHNGNQRLTREADDMADIALAALGQVHEQKD